MQGPTKLVLSCNQAYSPPAAGRSGEQLDLWNHGEKIMQRYWIHIESVDPGHQWIRQFITNLRVQNAFILYFASFDSLPFNTAQKEYKKAAQEKFDCTLHLLLRPQEYKHPLRSYAALYQNLQTDPQAILVYDTKGMEYWPSNNAIGARDVLELKRHFEEQFGQERVLCRRHALQHIRELIRSKECHSAISNRNEGISHESETTPAQSIFSRLRLLWTG